MYFISLAALNILNSCATIANVVVKQPKEDENREDLTWNANRNYEQSNYIEQMNVSLAPMPGKVILRNGDTTPLYACIQV